jgi:signal transduction histidine kinase/ActR/RegA family two-component response regulator
MTSELGILQQALRRERIARAEAEALLEKRSLALYRATIELAEQREAILRDRDTREWVLYSQNPVPIIEIDARLAADLAGEMFNLPREARTEWMQKNASALLAQIARCRVVSANRAALDMLEMKSAEEVALSQSMIFDAAFVQALAEHLLQLFNGDGEAGLEATLSAKSGRRIDVLIHTCATPTADGRLQTMVCTMIDVSLERALRNELKAAHEAAEKAIAEKDHWLATTHHELRTPLNAVLEFSRQLAEGVHQGDPRPFLQSIHEGAQQLQRLLDDYSDIQRGVQGRLSMAFADVDLEAMCAGIERVWAPAFAAKGLEFHVTSGTGPLIIKADRQRLRQVVDNLLTNALRHTENGAVSVCVNRHGDWLMLSVGDTGRGFGTALLREIAADQGGAPLEGASGDGLGLSIVRTIAHALGGRLTCRDLPMGGAHVCVEVPLMQPRVPLELAHAFPENGPEGASTLSGRSLSILAAEDNPVGRRVLSAMINILGGDLTLAEDGASAIQAADARRFDLILMDVLLPGIDGVEACRSIRSGQGPNQSTPIIAITANAAAGDRHRLIAAGMNDVLLKPIDGPSLWRVLERWGSGPTPQDTVYQRSGSSAT